MNLNGYNKLYQKYLEKSGKSRATTNLYTKTSTDFCEMFGDYQPEDLSRKNINLFIKSLEKRTKGDVDKTKLYFLKQLRYFFEFIMIEGASVGVKPVEIAKIDSNLQKKLHKNFRYYSGPIIDEQDIDKLDLYWLKHTEEQTLMALRNRAIINIFAETGAKVSELRNLKINDLHGSSIHISGRWIKLSKSATERLKKYLSRRPDQAEDMFVSYSSFNEDKITSHPLTTRGIQRVVKKTADEVGIGDNITPKVLRNSLFVKVLMDKEFGYNDLTKFFGLSPKNTSYQRYLARAKKEMENG